MRPGAEDEYLGRDEIATAAAAAAAAAAATARAAGTAAAAAPAVGAAGTTAAVALIDVPKPVAAPQPYLVTVRANG